MCERGSLKRFFHHAASPKTRLVQQHFSKVSHLSIWGMLITAEDIRIKWIQYPVLEVNLYLLELPEERVLSSIHPGAEGQTWILSKWWNNQSERQRKKNKASRQHNLHRQRCKMYFVNKKNNSHAYYHKLNYSKFLEFGIYIIKLN